MFASHEATRTGAPLILLNLVQHFARTGQYELFLFCDSPGPLLDAFGVHAHIIKSWTHKPLESSPTTEDLFEDFGCERPVLAICSTSAVPHYSEGFKRLGIPVVTLVQQIADRISLVQDQLGVSFEPLAEGRRPSGRHPIHHSVTGAKRNGTFN